MKILGLILLSLASLSLSCKSGVEETYLVGTYTSSSSEGINIIQFDASNKEIKIQQVIDNIDNPSFVVANRNKKIVVAVGETEGKNGGQVVSFWYDKKTKSFTRINSLHTLGNHPCTVAFSPDEKYVLVGNYTGGNISVFKIDEKGQLSENPQLLQYSGKSINAERQEKPHVHCIVFHPIENKIFVADLGLDNIKMIPFNTNYHSFLEENKEIDFKVNPGAGPRHLVWNKEGTKLYVTFELTNEVAVFDYKNDNLTLLQTISLTKPTKSGSAAELRLSADERFLYASVRGKDNKLVVIKVDENNSLEKIQEIETEETPRNFIITANQKNILVGNQKSNSIVVYDRDKNTGLLINTKNKVSIPKPVYFYPF
ncbi:beta-propeller fold lactonase family protein [Flavobacterium sp. LMO8]|uniref:lactonase family protein n=1 Tax=Flavobacterium sp. LMO8 TaxID=2654244 RepID=UPI0012913E9F|nr:lactonase family protein [Flavobacterium sp. LMO8]MQP25798.1 beta-propeller fold lactonase family protein [Flavobacterium sp. LMO8]